ncbi:Six-hairpin glycosidase-like protein [Tricladium varicosporioides]|nr:Six-hairpin glycosidase-like protein [Hymenoscyphus varicosporioides]
MLFPIFRASSLLFLSSAAAQASSRKHDGPDYDSLPLITIFPGPWENGIRAPVNKSHIVPTKIFNYEGAVSGAESVLQTADRRRGLSWVISPGGLVTFEFEENIAGRVCFEVNSIKHNPYVVISYSESPFFTGREPDATGDRQERDLALKYSIKHKGQNCVGEGYIRGGFKYLTVFMPENDVPSEEGFWHVDRSSPQRADQQTKPWYEIVGQRILGWRKASKNDTTTVPEVRISSIWVNCTAFPSQPNGRAYTGYFDSSSSLLNRVWYAGAYTLQLSTIDPREGGAILDFNRLFDHNTAPQGGWYSNFTIANGSAVTTDGAKRDRMVWPGDMTIAVPGIAISTYDMLAVRNALDTIYDHQYWDGSMPYAGPPMGFYGEFSDTYHLHTLIGTHAYVLYSGDLDWLKRRWPAYLKALDISIAKVDEFNLLHVSSIYDWIRPGMTGHNIEASSILYDVLGKSIELASWLGVEPTSKVEAWVHVRSRLVKGIATLYCAEDALFSDNKGRRSCTGSEKVLPQDGNSWALISGASSPSLAHNISLALRSRWTKFGAPAAEFPNVISPFASSFELLGHVAAKNHDAAVELIELMWGYMLDGPGMTNSTLIEGYRIDGYIHYPAYRSVARNSHAHGWSTGPTTVLTQGILGIRLTSPLGKTWEIEPCLSRWLSYARGGFATKLGKFEVSVRRMRTVSTGRAVEALNITVPAGSSGILTFGGKSQSLSTTSTTSFSFSFFTSPGKLSGLDKNVWVVEDWSDLVEDGEWIKPKVEERPVGVIDWEVLERGYGFAEMRYAHAKAGLEQDRWGGRDGELKRKDGWAK